MCLSLLANEAIQLSAIVHLRTWESYMEAFELAQFLKNGWHPQRLLAFHALLRCSSLSMLESLRLDGNSSNKSKFRLTEALMHLRVFGVILSRTLLLPFPGCQQSSV